MILENMICIVKTRILPWNSNSLNLAITNRSFQRCQTHFISDELGRANGKIKKTIVPPNSPRPTVDHTAVHHTTMHCTTVHHTAPLCTKLHCTTLHCTVPLCTTLQCTTLHCTVLLCTTLHHCAPHCSSPHCTPLYRCAPHCSASHCTAQLCKIVTCIIGVELAALAH